MSELTIRQRLELGIEVLDSAISQVNSLSQDSLTREWLKELHARKKVLVGQLQLLALEFTDALAQITEE
jgi:hypothetical protein